MKQPTEPDYKALLNQLIDAIDAETKHSHRMMVFDAVMRAHPPQGGPPGDAEATGILRGLTEAHNRVRLIVQDVARLLPEDK